MKVFNYKNYQHYVDSQIEANISKEDLVWADIENIKVIAEDYPNPSSILCHGTRNGAEQRMFKELYPSAYVIGTEISHTALKYPMTIQHDFNKNHSALKDFDIIYSNAFDHCFNPIDTINIWLNQLSKNGSMYIEYSFHRYNNISRESDPLEITKDELTNLLNSFGTVEWVKEANGNDVFVFKIIKKN